MTKKHLHLEVTKKHLHQLLNPLLQHPKNQQNLQRKRANQNHYSHLERNRPSHQHLPHRLEIRNESCIFVLITNNFVH